MASLASSLTGLSFALVLQVSILQPSPTSPDMHPINSYSPSVTKIIKEIAQAGTPIICRSFPRLSICNQKK